MLGGVFQIPSTQTSNNIKAIVQKKENIGFDLLHELELAEDEEYQSNITTTLDNYTKVYLLHQNEYMQL